MKIFVEFISQNCRKAFSFLLLFTFCGIAAQDLDDRTEAAIINVQRVIVAKLSGHEPIKGKKKISSRYTSWERRVTADYLMTLLKGLDLKPQKQSYNVKNKNGDLYTGSNVYATLKATNGSKEHVIIAAHYDTVEHSPGAVHNATGIAIAYYAMSKIAQLGNRNKNFTIVFFDQWTKNMIGPIMFAKKLKADKTKVHSMHRADYMGWDNDEDRAIEMLASNLSIESQYRIHSTIPIYKRNAALPESKVFGNFGYDSVTITAELRNSDNSPYIRKTEDKYTTVNFKYLASTTDLVTRVMKSIALE